MEEIEKIIGDNRDNIGFDSIGYIPYIFLGVKKYVIYVILPISLKKTRKNQQKETRFYQNNKLSVTPNTFTFPGSSSSAMTRGFIHLGIVKPSFLPGV